jgi:predicted Zn-dependent protease
MRHWALWMGIAVVCAVSNRARCQTPAQIQIKRALGDALAKDVERQFDRIADPSIVEYLQRIENRLALASGAKPLEVRLVRNSKQSAIPFPNGVLYISSGLLERIESEAELAGLLAHEMAHEPWQTIPPTQSGGTIPLLVPPCALSSPGRTPLVRQDRREPEQQATATAVKTLQAAGYDPEAVLTLFSKLSYEHPAWSKAIVSDDLLDLRATVETEVPPVGGYMVDGSAFVQMRTRLAEIVGTEARRTPPPSLTK